MTGSVSLARAEDDPALFRVRAPLSPSSARAGGGGILATTLLF